MKKKIKILSRKISLWILLCCGFWLGINAMAAHGGEVQIGVQPIFPENQRNIEVGFFDLILEQGAKQTIEIEISNLSTENPIVVLIEAATATTDNGGVVHYTPRRGEGQQVRDNTLPFAFEELVSVPGRLELAPGEVRRLPITIDMPDVSFDGVIAGGFGISQEIDLEAARDEAGLILNLFNFEIPVIIRQSENLVQPELQILEVGASQWNLRNIIAVHLQNPEMMFINLMNIQAYVIEKDSGQVVVEHFAQGLQMAPNSNFEWGIPLRRERFTEGDFILQMEVTSRNGEWSFTEEFRIELEQANAWNEIAVIEERVQEETTREVQKVMLLLVLLGLMVAVMMYFLIAHHQKKKHKQVRDSAIREILREIEED